jgi:tripartite-type tricarboxylate transporter receptor subunit TctC
MPSVVEALEKIGISVEYKGPDEFKKKIMDDYRSMEKIVKAAGLRK